MIPLDSIHKISSIFVGEIIQVVLSLWEGIRMLKDFSFFSENLGGVIHHFYCGENLLVALKYIDLIGFFFWCEFKYDRGGIFIVFENYFCSIVFHCIEVIKIDNNVLSFSFFFYFSVVVGTISSSVLALDVGGDFTPSANKGVSMVLPFVLSVGNSTVSELRGCGIVVGAGWYLGYLLTSFLIS